MTGNNIKLIIIIVLCIFCSQESVARKKKDFKELHGDWYTLGQKDLEFFNIVRKDQVERPPDHWKEMLNTDQTTYYAFPQSNIEQNDIEAIWVHSKATNKYSGHLEILFKPEAWDRTYEAGIQSGWNIGIKQNNKLVVAKFSKKVPGIAVTLSLRQEDEEQFLEELERKQKFDIEILRKKVLEWLEKRIRNNPYDNIPRLALADRIGIDIRFSHDYVRAAAVLKEAINFDVREDFVSNMHINLARFYTELKDYDKAILTYQSFLLNKIRTNSFYSESHIRLKLADLYEKKEHYKDAINEISQAVESSKKVPSTFPKIFNLSDEKIIELRERQDKLQSVRNKRIKSFEKKLPIYPQAEQIEVKEQPSEEYDLWIDYKVEATEKEIIDFYQGKLKNDGWEKTTEKEKDSLVYHWFNKQKDRIVLFVWKKESENFHRLRVYLKLYR